MRVGDQVAELVVLGGVVGGGEHRGAGRIDEPVGRALDVDVARGHVVEGHVDRAAVGGLPLPVVEGDDPAERLGGHRLPPVGRPPDVHRAQVQAAERQGATVGDREVHVPTAEGEAAGVGGGEQAVGRAEVGDPPVAVLDPPEVDPRGQAADGADVDGAVPGDLQRRLGVCALELRVGEAAVGEVGRRAGWRRGGDTGGADRARGHQRRHEREPDPNPPVDESYRHRNRLPRVSGPCRPAGGALHRSAIPAGRPECGVRSRLSHSGTAGPSRAPPELGERPRGARTR